MKQITHYQSSDHRLFNTQEECQAHEAYQADLQERMRTSSCWDEAELEYLIQQLKEARESAHHPDLIHTLTPQGLALMSMRGVCERFVSKHAHLKMA